MKSIKNLVSLSQELVKKIPDQSKQQETLQNVTNKITTVKTRIEKFNAIVLPVLEKSQEYLNKIDKNRLDNFVDDLEKHKQQEPYFQKLVDQVVNNDNMTFAHETLALANFWRLMEENEDNLENLSVLDIISTSYFEEQFLSYFENLSLGVHFSKRNKILSEALQLYRLEYYIGCLPILYGQLEGILTDFLVEHKHLKPKSKSFVYIGETIKNRNSDIVANQYINGLNDKIIIAKKFYEYFDHLEAYKLDGELSIREERNAILHGNNLEAFTKERCFILFLWLDSILQFLEKLEAEKKE